MIDFDFWCKSIFECVFYGSLIIQLLYLVFIYGRNLFLKIDDSIVDFKESISVVICARNEFENLQQNLPKILNQNYHDFELVVVNDRSWDGTQDFLEKLSEEHSNIKIVNVPDSEMNTFAGKKFAKTLGVKGASNEYLLFTDADCEPSSENWIYEMSKHFVSKDVLIGVSPLKGGEGLWAFLSRFDSLMIAYNYISYFLAKNPYMAVGRNMATKKSTFFSVKGFKSHYNIPSGDDDLFLRDVKKQSKVGLVYNPEALTTSKPCSSFKSWIKQKKRHFLTAPKYSFFNKALLGIYALSYLFLMVSFISLLALNSLTWIALALFMARYTLHLMFAYNSFKLMDELNKLILFPILELVLFILNGLFFYSNIFIKPSKW